jgi:hypothetical protein
VADPKHPTVLFKRYADDAVVHCDSEALACMALARIAERMHTGWGSDRARACTTLAALGEVLESRATCRAGGRGGGANEMRWGGREDALSAGP